MSPHSLVIVGGGITGLAAAFRALELEPSRSVVVLEASSRAGGLLQTERTDDGYIIERGPDSMITTKPAALSLALRLGLGDEIVRTRTEGAYGAYVVSRGRLQRIPDGFSVVAPTKISPLMRSGLLSTFGTLRAAAEVLLPQGYGLSPSSALSSADESLASFVRRRYGAELLERLAQPLAGGIYGADPEELSLSATMPRFLQLERLYGSVTRGLRRTSRQPGQQASGARYGLFISFRQGIAALPERLAQLLGDRVRLSTPVERIEKKAGGGYRVHTAGAVSWDAGAVLLAMPASKAAGLLQDSFPEISNSLKHIEYGSAATVSFGFSRSDVPHPLDAYGFVVPSVERRVVLASTWASAKWPGRAPLGKVLIRVFLGGADYPDIDDWDESTLILAARRGLRDLMGVVADPELVRVDRYVRSMPRYCTGHQARVAQIMGSLGLRDSGDPGDPSSSLGPQETLHLTERFEKNAPTTGLFLAGNAYSGVGIPNSIASGERAAELALQELCRIESSRALLNA